MEAGSVTYKVVGEVLRIDTDNPKRPYWWVGYVGPDGKDRLVTKHKTKKACIRQIQEWNVEMGRDENYGLGQ